MRLSILPIVLLASGAVAGPFKRDDILPTDETETTPTLELPSSTSSVAVAAPTETFANPCVLLPGDDEHEPLIIDSAPCYCRCLISTCKTYTNNEVDLRFCLETRDWWKAQQSKLPYWWNALGTYGACTGSQACSKAPNN